MQTAPQTAFDRLAEILEELEGWVRLEQDAEPGEVRYVLRARRLTKGARVRVEVSHLVDEAMQAGNVLGFPAVTVEERLALVERAVEQALAWIPSDNPSSPYPEFAAQRDAEYRCAMSAGKGALRSLRAAAAGRRLHDAAPLQAAASAADAQDSRTPEAGFEARALLLILDHPDWTVQQIAEALGCSRATFYRRLEALPRLSALWEANQQNRLNAKAALPGGFKDKKRNIEAWERKAN